MKISLLSDDVLFSHYLKTVLGEEKTEIIPINNIEDFNEGNLLIDCALYDINEVLNKCLTNEELNKNIILITDDFFDKNMATPFRIMERNLSDINEIYSKIISAFQAEAASAVKSQALKQEWWDKTPLVLLADDSRIVRDTVKNKLEVKSYNIKIYANGQELLDYLLQYPHADLILLDNEMPVKDGISTLIELKSNPGLSQIPVLFLSGITDKEQIVKALELGAADYISKPFDDNEFYARVNVHLKINWMSSKLKKQNEHIREQADKLKTVNDKLLELDKFKEGLTGMIVHDLKNPLNAIINVPKSASPENQVLQMKQAGKQMLDMVLNILDVNKYEETNMTIEMSSRSLFKLSENAINSIKFLAERKNISIENTIPRNKTVNADSEIVERVFTNMLTNAIKYNPNNGKISLHANIAQNQPDFIKIAIKDTGVGIPSDKIHLVFDKFEQVQAKKSGNIRSTGLGLTFCKMAVEAHGGEIGVESELQKGTTFWFTLQLRETPEPEEDKCSDTTDLHNKYTLSPAEKQALAPFLKLLKKCKIYKIFEIRKILKNIDDKESGNIKRWKEDIQNAIGVGNEERYNELINV